MWQTRLLLIRHALVDVGDRLCGSLDLPLSAAGRAQVGGLLRQPAARARPDALYASTLVRAREVAAALSAVWGLPVRVEDALREIHCGDVEGMPLAEVQRAMPDLWARNSAQVDDGFAWPGGENYAGFRHRILAGLREIAGAHPARRIAVVTHAGVVSQVLGAIRGRPPARWEVDRPDPLTCTEVEWIDGAPSRVISYNDADWY